MDYFRKLKNVNRLITFYFLKKAYIRSCLFRMIIYKNKIAIFFSILFLSFIIAPTIVTMVDSSIDISFIYSNSEEESENLKVEKEKIVFSSLKMNDDNFTSTKKVSALMHKNKNYTKPYLNMVFPPPEYL